jgi:hypothetical protein
MCHSHIDPHHLPWSYLVGVVNLGEGWCKKPAAWSIVLVEERTVINSRAACSRTPKAPLSLSRVDGTSSSSIWMKWGKRQWWDGYSVGVNEV